MGTLSLSSRTTLEMSEGRPNSGGYRYGFYPCMMVSEFDSFRSLLFELSFMKSLFW